MHAVGMCDRCKSIVEPRISTQWFMKMKPLAEPAKEVVNANTIEVVPDNQRTILLQLARKYSRLVHLAPALVGASHSDLALRRLQGDGSGARFARRNFRGARARGERAHEVPEMRRLKTYAGYRRARHVVQLGAVAVFHARLAGRH